MIRHHSGRALQGLTKVSSKCLQFLATTPRLFSHLHGF